MTLTIKTKQVFAYGTMAILTLIVGRYVYWSTQSNLVLEVKNDPMPVQPAEVQADGGQIVVTVDFCKYKHVTGYTKVYLVGETKGQKPEINWPLDDSAPQCLKAPVPIFIPASVQTDTYHVVFETTYRVNPLKEQVVVFRSRSFRVVNNRLSPGGAQAEPSK